MTRSLFGHDYADTTLLDVLNDIREEERVAQRALSIAGRQGGKVSIKPRTMGLNCDDSCSGTLPHRLVLTQGKTRWYKDHQCYGTEFFAECLYCGETDSWITGESVSKDTGGNIRGF